MRFHLTPTPLLHLITTILLAPQSIIAKPHPVASELNGFSFNELFARYECGSNNYCGWNNQLCCPAGASCYTDYNDQAQCATGVGGAYSSAAPAYTSNAGGGYWVYVTSTMVRTDLVTVTTVLSSYVPQASGLVCNYAINESPCGTCCCKGGEYCASMGHCLPAAPGQTTVKTTQTVTPGAPIRPASSGVVVVTQTQKPTTTVGFLPPVASGANVTMTEQASHSGLSGGAIAGIVIGVLVGLLILGLICFYCCLKGLLDGCLALFGLGGRKKRRTEVEEYERRSHHASGGGRTWYGAAKPSRVERREKRSSNLGKEALGLAGGLGALWAILGLKRRHDKKKDSRYGGSDSSYSYSYTSTSSSSTSDRRTRTHRSYSRSRR